MPPKGERPILTAYIDGINSTTSQGVPPLFVFPETHIWAISSLQETGGITSAKAGEISPGYAVCDLGKAYVGDKLIANKGRYTFMHFDGHKYPVIIQLDNLNDLKPLSSTEIKAVFPHETANVSPLEVFSEPNKIPLIYVGKAPNTLKRDSEENEAFFNEIKMRTGVNELMHIDAGWEPNEGQVVYIYDDGEAHIKVYPSRGKSHLDIQIGNQTTGTESSPYARYNSYIQGRNRAIGYRFLTDAATLSTGSIQWKYPRPIGGNYVGGPEVFEERLPQLTRYTNEPLTEEEARMWVNLRMIPSEQPQDIYMSGFQDGSDGNFVHPSVLDDSGLTRHVLDYYKDSYRIYFMEQYFLQPWPNPMEIFRIKNAQEQQRQAKIYPPIANPQ